MTQKVLEEMFGFGDRNNTTADKIWTVDIRRIDTDETGLCRF